MKNGRYISMIKAASKAAKGGEIIGKVLGKAGKASKAVHEGLAEAGENAAMAMGKDPKSGRLVGKAVLPVVGTGAAAESDYGKRMRARHGVLVPEEYGGHF